MINWSVLQLSPPFSTQNRSSFPKSVLAKFRGLEIDKEFLEIDENSIQHCETVTEIANKSPDGA